MRHGQPSPTRSIPWRAPLLAVVCAGVLIAVGWRVVDQRLAAEAQRQAVLGASPAVAALRDDWAEAILPVALGESGPIAERARRVASVRINRLIAGATKEDRLDLKQASLSILQTLRETEATPTAEAAQWAEWVSQRLTEAADRLPPKSRLELLSAVDQTLTSLAQRARRESPRPELPVAPIPTVVETPKPAIRSLVPEETWVGALPIPIAAKPVSESPPKPAVVERPLAPEPKEPQAWNPDWVTAVPPTIPEPPEPAPSSNPAERSARELLGELVRLASQLPTETEASSAAGPTSVPKPPDQEDDPYTDLRSRVERLRAELTSRGFYAVSTDQVASLLSDDAAVRAELASRLLTDRRGGAARLLVVLSEDPSPAVRAAAIAALGSSADPQLTRLAWELAMKDKAPEVGRLAEGLRSRLR